MKKKDKILLPPGLQDVMPPDAAKEARIISALLKNFENWGYVQVKTPMAEFEESLISSKNKQLSRQAFRVMDQSTGRMMAIRPDITTQIARVAAVRMKNWPRPLRISYSGQVLHAKGAGLYAERQLAQAGAELIGDFSPASDSEVIFAAVDSLIRLGIEDISVDFSMPMLSEQIMKEAKTPIGTRKTLLDLIEKKDLAGIKETDDKSAKLLASLVASAGTASRTLKAITKLNLSKKSMEYCQRLEKIITSLEASGVKASFTIDPLDRRGFEYHTGISFSLFSKKGKEELGRGGRYKIDFGKEEDAVGFTLSVNALMRVIPSTETKQKIFVPFGTETEESTKLREEGLITINALKKSGNSEAEAKRLGCHFIYKKGKILPLK